MTLLRRFPFASVALLLLSVSASGAAAMDMTASDDQVASTGISKEQLLSGDPQKGRKLYLRCRSCHNLTDAKRHLLGPNLYGILGRQAGKADGYRYSKALSEADFVWTVEKLNEWLTKPNAFLPGNKMVFAGIRSQSERNDLISYLKEATEIENLSAN